MESELAFPCNRGINLFSEFLSELAIAFDCSAVQLLLLSSPASLLSCKCWFQEHSLINCLHSNLHLRIGFPGNSTCDQGKGLPGEDSSVQLSSVWLFVTPWIAAHQASLYHQTVCSTHIHWFDDAIQPSHPLSPPSPLPLSLSWNQSLFQWVSYLHQVAKVLELQYQSFQWIFRTDFL